MNAIYCFFRGHDWHNPKNVRSAVGPEALFVPILFIYAFCGEPKQADYTCRCCGKVKTLPHPLT